jgi:aminoglycoside phosphotransferase (APT) family kinase protein
VKLHPDDTVVKSGRRIHLEEKDALDLAAELNIPAPRVHEASTAPDGIVSIRMDFIEGESLEELWPTMSEEERQDICRQLREILVAMQSAKSNTGVIGSCKGGQFRECRRMGEYTGGPYQDEAGFNKYIANVISTTPTDIRDALHSQLRTDHRIVFAHGDLSQHNILIKDMKISGLIDWEYGGWFPEYWDYVKFFEISSKNRDWREYAKYIFPRTYFEELAVYQGILRWGSP